MSSAGIILAGGRSTRMGEPKAALDWRGSTLLRRAVGLVDRVVDGPVVVVRARGQELPTLPAGIEIVEDAHEGRGPLQGMAAGLQAIGRRCDSAYVCGVDAPLQHPAFIRHVLRSLSGEHDVALPHARGFDHPLAAAYRTRVAARIEQQIANDDLATGPLMDRLRVRRLDVGALRADPAIAALDPELDSLLNLNTREEYDAARALKAPAVTVRCSGSLRVRGLDATTLRVTTVGAAAAAIGIQLGGDTVTLLNSERIVRDPQEPLATGDGVLFTRPPRSPV